ncbi:MAG: hypothetical protein IT392_05195 [Nitrospirae bacterium]|nr:hypothetical protein [Nitrospirota bacterium]
MKESVNMLSKEQKIAQVARLVKTETGYELTQSINRYDRRPFTLVDILQPCVTFNKL